MTDPNTTASDDLVAALTAAILPELGKRETTMTPILWAPTHQHLKSGGLYRVVTRGHMEADYPDTAVVVYDDAQCRVFVRPAAEFDDGRFAALTNDSLDAGPVQPEPPADLVERVAKEVEGDIAEVIGDDAYDCLRVWSAWSYGTMREDDFHPIIHDPARLREISTAAVRAVLALLQPRMDAADALLRAVEPTHRAFLYGNEPDRDFLHAKLGFAIEVAKAAGIGGE